MQVAIVTGQGRLEWREEPEPEPGPASVVVDIRYCGICGTDVHAYKNGGPYPATLCGHEWTGAVSKVGRDVTALAEGDRVVVAMTPACGTCAACRAGQADWCTPMFSSLMADPGGSPHGGYASSIAASADRVMWAHPALSDVEAAMVEPATVAFHGVRRAGIRLGDVVVVQGVGPIGAFALQWARIQGAATVIVVEPNEHRAALAAQLGADVVVTPDAAADTVAERTGGLGADVVVECAGVPDTVQHAVDRVRRGGQVMLIGLSDLPATIHPGLWLAKEVTVRGSVAYLRPEFEWCMAMMADGRIAAEPLHTSTVGPDGLRGAFDALSSGTGTGASTKILFDPTA
jgi:(R,R)-butanediol dehydrogenase / meso-butanediol dehydrogenase / diacetyl reductase